MMDHVEKERLAFSAAIAAAIYIVFFLATAWLDILKPEDATEYFGPLFVEIVPEPTVDPVRIVREQPEVFPDNEAVAVRTEPVITSRPDQTAVAQTPPEVQSEPELTFIPQETDVVSEPELTTVTSSSEAAETTVVDEPFDPGPAGEEALPTRTFTAQTQPVGGDQTAQAEIAAASSTDAEALDRATGTQNSTAQQAAPVVDSSSTGTDEAVSDRLSETGTSQFTAVSDDTPTDQFGENRIIYGDSDPVADGDSEVTAEAVATTGTGDAEETSVLDSGRLDSVEAALERTGNGNGNGSGTGQIGTDTATESGTGVAESSESPFEIEAIESEDSASVRQRGIRSHPEAVLPENFTLEGQTRLEVPVLFEILSTGLVRNVKIERPSGYTEIDTAITEAIRKWKFEPVASDKKVKVRLKYVITAE